MQLFPDTKGWLDVTVLHVVIWYAPEVVGNPGWLTSACVCIVSTGRAGI